MTFRAFVESTQKSTGKRRRMHSSSDAITQEVRRGRRSSQCNVANVFTGKYVSLSVCEAKSRNSLLLFQFMDLRTRYTALVTLTTQHVKYISDALRRLEEEEVCLALSFVRSLLLVSSTFLCARGVGCLYRQYISIMMTWFPPPQKEVEEERQQRVGQVSELLGWVKGLQGRAGDPSAESSIAAQEVQKYEKYLVYYGIEYYMHPLFFILSHSLSR